MKNHKPSIVGQSLLNPEQTLDLIPQRTTQEIIDAGNELLGRSGEFTAAFLAKKRPEVYAAALHYVKEGLPQSHICSILKISTNTLAALIAREEPNLPQAAKDYFLGKVKSLARMSMDKLQELMPDMDARDTAIVTGILIDKFLLLQGEATVIVKHQHDMPTHDAFNAMIAQLPQANITEIPSDNIHADKLSVTDKISDHTDRISDHADTILHDTRARARDHVSDSNKDPNKDHGSRDVITGTAEPESRGLNNAERHTERIAARAAFHERSRLRRERSIVAETPMPLNISQSVPPQ